MTAGGESPADEALRAAAAIRTGWELVKPNYWLFLGIAVVGMLIGSACSIVLMGPMLCGIFFCYIRLERGEPVEFGDLFKGFDYFGTSVIANLILTAFGAGLGVVALLLFVTAGLIGSALEEALGIAGAVMAVLLVLFAVLVAVGLGLLLQALTLFVFPLIVDRNEEAWPAIVTSFRTAREHIRQLVLFCLLLTLIGLLGAMVCGIGAYFVAPLTFAAQFVVYRKLFPQLQTPGGAKPGPQPPTEPPPTEPPPEAPLD